MRSRTDLPDFYSLYIIVRNGPSVNLRFSRTRQKPAKIGTVRAGATGSLLPRFPWQPPYSPLPKTPVPSRKPVAFQDFAPAPSGKIRATVQKKVPPDNHSGFGPKSLLPPDTHTHTRWLHGTFPFHSLFCGMPRPAYTAIPKPEKGRPSQKIHSSQLWSPYYPRLQAPRSTAHTHTAGIGF